MTDTAEPMSFDADQAADRLGRPFTADFLRGNLDRLPHIRLGHGRGRAGRVGFTQEHLDQIVRMHSVAPPTPAVVHEAFTPITRRRTA